MDANYTLNLEKQSDDLVNILREKWTKEGFYFRKEGYGKAKEEHPKINPLADTQKILDYFYYNDWITKWNEYRIHVELIEHIQFIHKNRHNIEIFNKHKADVLELLINLKSFNNSAVEKISSNYSFWHLNSILKFWNSLCEMQWDVEEIDFHVFRNYSLDDKGQAKGENTNYYCYELLFYVIGRDGSINKTRLGADFAKNTPVPIANLFGKNKNSKLYFKDLLDKSLNILTSYGFFIREKKKGKEDSFHPTLFLKMHKDIYTKGIEINKGFFDLDAISLNKFSTNYCNLLNKNHSSEIDRNIQKYINKLIECDKANFTLSQFHLAHKLAANESGIELLTKYI